MSKLDSRELPEEALASLDEFGNRIFIYPAAVQGLWHKRRTVFQLLLLLVFLLLPWLKIGGQQALLLDLAGRRFAIFGLTFWAHDGPLVFFVLAGAVFALALLTALFGRVWCGWACPQTVFIEMVFRRIETWIEGNHIERRRLNESDLTLTKLSKKISKWTLFTISAWIVGNTFLMYFVGTDRWLEMLQSPPSANWVSFWVMLIVLLVTLFDFGWFREQFCIIACPYGRFQSVLLDTNSLAIMYDTQRGEPRRGTPGIRKEALGDCVNCYKCVAVCPTAIDIRRGLQMECIACTACADACDEVMTKLKKPKGLIRYSSERGMEGHKTLWVRARVIAYAVIVALLGIGLAISIARREPVNIAVLRAKEAPYRDANLNNGEAALINHFELALKNNEFSPIKVQIEVSDLRLREIVRVISATPTFDLQPGGNSRAHVFFEFPKSLTQTTGSRTLDINVSVFSADGQRRQRREHIELLGPKS